MDFGKVRRRRFERISQRRNTWTNAHLFGSELGFMEAWLDLAKQTKSERVEYLFNELASRNRGNGAYADPGTPAQLTVVYDGDGITHIGFHLNVGREQMIYDPVGGYAGKFTENNKSDLILGRNADLGEYVRHTYSQGGPVSVLTPVSV
jgi:hypothetical protein